MNRSNGIRAKRPVAFVTGASRGIGSACAVELAARGFDLALTARTLREGKRREHSSTIARSSMIENGGGSIIVMTSASGYTDPPAAAGEGGWGMGYGISKAGAHRIPGMLKAEHERDGIRIFLVHPGLTASERVQADMKQFGFEGGAPVEVPAKVVAWLATSPETDGLTGSNIEAQFLCHERGLLPG